MWREPKPLRALTSTGNGRSSGSSAGSQVGGEPIPCSSKKTVREVLVGAARDRLLVGHEHDRGAELVPRLREHDVVEVGQRHDQPDVVQRDEVAQGVDVAGVVDARDERAVVGVVERRRERVDVGRDRRRAGAAERRDDVDALPGAREEDGGHGSGGYRGAVKAPLAAGGCQPPVSPL